jgi:hypothetical protein
MVDKNFHQTVTRLLAMIDHKHDHGGPQLAYTVGVDNDLRIDLIGLQEGFLNLRAVVGQLPNSSENGVLLRLLQANNFAFEHPPVSIGIDPETASITVWSRQALSELNDDIRCQWFNRFIRIASAVRAWWRSSDRVLPLDVSVASTNPTRNTVSSPQRVTR